MPIVLRNLADIVAIRFHPNGVTRPIRRQRGSALTVRLRVIVAEPNALT
jgi:hypothetical protein